MIQVLSAHAEPLDASAVLLAMKVNSMLLCTCIAKVVLQDLPNFGLATAFLGKKDKVGSFLRVM